MSERIYRLRGMGVDVIDLVERVTVAAEFALDQMEMFNPYDHHAACALALKRVQQIVDLDGLDRILNITAIPKPLRKMEINIKFKDGQ